MTDRDVMQQALDALENERYVSTHIVDAITALRTALEQPEQEPVAWMSDNGSVASMQEKKMGYVLESAFTIPLYTTPPAAQRKPLTDEQLGFMVIEHLGPSALARGKISVYDAFMLGITSTEAAHNIKEGT